MPLIQNDTGELSCFLAKNEHQTIGGREVELVVFIKAGSDLYHEVVIPMNITILDVHIARWIFEQELFHGRHLSFPQGIGDKPLLDAGNEVDVCQGFLDLVESIYFRHFPDSALWIL